MKIFLALGMEMGNWEEHGNMTYNIMVNQNRIVLTEEQYSVWLLGQQAGFTLDKAAEYLKKNVFLVDTLIRDLIHLKVIIYWDEHTLSELSNYYLTPRGHAGSMNNNGEQLLISYVHAEPIAVDSFGHNLWVHSNAFVPLHETLVILSSKLNITLEEAYTDCYYWVAFLVRHGLAALNPSVD